MAGANKKRDDVKGPPCWFYQGLWSTLWGFLGNSGTMLFLMLLLPHPGAPICCIQAVNANTCSELQSVGQKRNTCLLGQWPLTDKHPQTLLSSNSPDSRQRRFRIFSVSVFSKLGMGWEICISDFRVWAGISSRSLLHVTAWVSWQAPTEGFQGCDGQDMSQ